MEINHSYQNNGKSNGPTNQIPEHKFQPGLGNQLQNQERIINSWQPGHELKNGRFIIQQTLGEGGFGVAYLATDKELKRDVVIKTLNQRVQREPNFEKFKADFKKEAQRLSQCRHSNIVPIYDKFDEGQLPCIVMEYIAGETLACRLERGVLKETEALDYIRQIATALEVVHRKGLVHRDVKPGNIMIRAGTQEAVLIDFGIAREFHLNQITIYFSKSYAPLEQYTDEPKGPYTDVYALAATLYFLLTGNHPVPADQRYRHLNKYGNDPLEPQDLLKKNISTQVIKAILIGMKLLALQRPQSIKQWIDLLTITETEIPPNLNQTPATTNKNPARVNTTPGANQQQSIGEETTRENQPDVDTTFEILLVRTAVMGAVILLLAIVTLKLIVNFEIIDMVSLIICVCFIFAQHKLAPNEPKSYLFISAVIPTVLILLATFLKIVPGVEITSLIGSPIISGLLTIGAGAIAFTLMAIFKSVTR